MSEKLRLLRDVIPRALPERRKGERALWSRIYNEQDGPEAVALKAKYPDWQNHCFIFLETAELVDARWGGDKVLYLSWYEGDERFHAGYRYLNSEFYPRDRLIASIADIQ